MFLVFVEGEWVEVRELGRDTGLLGLFYIYWECVFYFVCSGRFFGRFGVMR